MPFIPEKPPLFGETLETLAEKMKAQGFSAFHAKQVLKWVYKRRVTEPEQMTDLSKPLRAWLAQTFDFEPARLLLKRGSDDVTDKLLLEMRDKALVECVLIRAPQEGEAKGRVRSTLCVSSQVGCACGCRFCASGLDGWKRDLSAGEIVAEMMAACRVEDARVPERVGTRFASFDNLVVMGMGEPLRNYDNVLRALAILNAPWGFEVGARKITISTSGIAPNIVRLAAEPAQFRLAISLHGATQEVRDRIMPINRKYPLAELLDAAKAYQRQSGRLVTFEYILIDEVNDGLEQTRALAAIARDIRCHINLIPYNTVEGLAWKRSPLGRRERFARVLRDAGISITLRKEKGDAIEAACGQLRLKTERERQS